MLDERARMAREIHDTIAHGLTGIVTQLEAAEQASDRRDDWRPPRRQRDPAGPREPGGGAALGRGVAPGGRWRAAPCEDGLADVAQRWSAINGVPVEFIDHRRPAAAPSGDRAGAAADRPGGAGQRRQARRRVAGRADPDVHGRRGRARRARRRGRLRGRRERPTGPGTGFGLTAMRQRVGRVAGTLAIESEPGGGTAISVRVPAIGAPPVGADLMSPDPAADRGRSPGRPRRPARHVHGRPGVRGRRRGRRRRGGRGPRRDAAARRRPHGPADARRGRRERDPPARRTRATRPGSWSSRPTRRTPTSCPALEAGATGYLLKDAPRAELVNAVRGGAPRRVGAGAVGRVAAREPAPAPGPGRAERPGARGAGADRPGRDQPRHGRPPVHLRGDGQDPPAAHLRQARRERPRRSRRDGLRTGSAEARIEADP